MIPVLLVALVTMLGALGVVAYRASFTGWYQAESIIRIGRGSNLSRHQETNAALLRSRLVLSKAAKDPAVAGILKNEPNPVQHLNKHLDLKFEKDSELMRVQFIGPDPTSSVVMLNGLVNAYIEVVSDATEEEGESQVQVIQEAQISKP